MKRVVVWFAALLVLVGPALTGAPLAHAQDDTPSSWRIPRYVADVDLARDGTARVRLEFDFDFRDDAGHGPFVTLPLRQRVAGDDDVWRMIDVDLGPVASPSGAAAQVDTTVENGSLVIRIGDPDQEWRGVQTYTVEYTARGFLAPGAASGLDELNWNAIGLGWQVPLDDVTVSVTGPADVERVACFSGASFDRPCIAGAEGDSARYQVDGLDPGEGMQVVAGFPQGTFVGAEPRFEKRFHVGNLFPLTPVSGGLTLGATVLGLALVLARTRRSARDEVYLGLTPGVTPAPGEVGQVGRASGDAPVAVQFQPPAGARPGEVGVLVDASADNVDVTATIIDLAVRGHLRIDARGEDWVFERLDRGRDPLTSAEEHVLGTMFGSRRKVSTDGLRDKQYHDLLPGARTRLYDRVTRELSWFKGNPNVARIAAIVGGIAIIVGGVVVGLGLAFAFGLGLVGLAGVVVGIAVIALNRRFGRRTALGSAVLAQTKGFELYLRTAEADQIRFEEGIDVFSRYLPYAIVFGVADRWTKLFQQLAAEHRYVADTSWYVAPHGFFYSPGFGHAMGDLSHSLSDSMRASVAANAATQAGSGGSGFSGGGGFGGGGGGGW